MKNFTVITLNRKNITDFAAERNELLKTAKSEWVFFLDRDETISPKLQAEIKRVIYKGSTLEKGYYVNRKNYFLGQCIGTDKIIRLGTKNSGRWERRVHEMWKIPARDQPLQGYLIHNTADNLHQYIDKINKYSSIHAQANKKEGKKSNLFKIIFYPIGKFFITFIKSGNVVFSIMQSLHSFLSWSKQWTIQNV